MKEYIVVIGGANVDVSATSFNPIKTEDSNPGKVQYRSGGVGRNIAENLTRLGVQTSFITALSDDIYSKMIIDECKEIGMDISLSRYIPNQNCGVYMCINDNFGEMFVAVSSMEICTFLDVEYISSHLDFINNANLVVLDTNIPEITLKYISEKVTSPLACDLVSVAKCLKAKILFKNLTLLKANRFEAEKICDRKITSISELDILGQHLNNLGVKNIIITLGEQGAYYYNAQEHGYIKPTTLNVINTTGCGDAFMAAACASFLKTSSLKEMAEYGVVAANITATHNGPVMPLISMDMIERQKKNYK